MNKKLLLPMLMLCLLLCGCAKDMTGTPYSEIEAYQRKHPNRKITYTVTIEGGPEAFTVTNEDSTLVLTDTKQLPSLLQQAEYLQHLQTLDMSAIAVDAADMNKIYKAFPEADIGCKGVRILGNVYPLDTTTIDLSDLTTDQVLEAVQGLRALPWLQTVELCKPDAVSTVSLDNAFALSTVCPNLIYNYRIEMFGQVLSTDMERVEYFRVKIGDDGLKELRKLLPMMHKLNYLKLDWCDTSDTAMVRLKNDYADRIKVVWRLFFRHYNFLTDTYKIWMNEVVYDWNSFLLNNCTDVRYLDLGHNTFTNIEFVRHMPNLEVFIMGDTKVESLEPLRECPNLEYLEMFSTKVKDLSPLADCKNLEYLNISNIYAEDLSPLYGLDKMRKINSTMNRQIPQEEIDKYKEQCPDVDATFLRGGDPTEYGWRRLPNGGLTPRYALLCWQIGYACGDVSGYPRGYVTEPITYESTGIKPPAAK